MKIAAGAAWGVLILAAGLVLNVTGCRQPAQPEASDGIELLALPASENYRRVDQPHIFHFPRDHGMHPGFRSEWWYLTGNLDSDGRRFGYQVTFFRFLVDPQEDADDAWEADAVWLAQAAVTDIENGGFLTSEHLSREMTGITEASDVSLDVRSNGWRLHQPDPKAPYLLSVEADEFSLELELKPAKPLILQGKDGLSRKSAEDPENASYYYSQTRMQTDGHLLLDGQSFAVHGLSWFDREWSSSALHARQAGWDWFALQLDDGHDLMFYRLRLDDGGIDEASAGVWVDPTGQSTRLRYDHVDVQPQEFWENPATGKRYPVAWTLNCEPLGLHLKVSAVMPGQVWQGSVSYWEGAVGVTGMDGKRPVSGRGYVELTGY